MFIAFKSTETKVKWNLTGILIDKPSIYLKVFQFLCPVDSMATITLDII